jgi:hypothetical protein
VCWRPSIVTRVEVKGRIDPRNRDNGESTLIKLHLKCTSVIRKSGARMALVPYSDGIRKLTDNRTKELKSRYKLTPSYCVAISSKPRVNLSLIFIYIHIAVFTPHWIETCPSFIFALFNKVYRDLLWKYNT